MTISSELRKPFKEKSMCGEIQDDPYGDFLVFMRCFTDYTDGAPEQREKAIKFLTNVYSILTPYSIDNKVLSVVDAALKFIFKRSRSLANTLNNKGDGCHSKNFKRQLRFILTASDPYPRIGNGCDNGGASAATARVDSATTGDPTVFIGTGDRVTSNEDEYGRVDQRHEGCAVTRC
ncbi:hypothetical protein ElyMa_004524500 [Elysia marginata]|uniref:Uncharacterized protein n=1 Tax=Elysia marginata TaxID=1093978 RepID=A0AAV4HM98_9GAST|nr:hypothetical protein ElyMa_004524500 [Elysia marginata]